MSKRRLWVVEIKHAEGWLPTSHVYLSHGLANHKKQVWKTGSYRTRVRCYVPKEEKGK